MSNTSSNTIYIKALSVFGISFLYTTIRYNYFGNVPLTDVATFIVNKTISLTMVFLMVVSLLESIKGEKQLSLSYLSIITQLAIMHVVLSLVLLSPDYFPKMYIDGKLTLLANLSLITGATLFTYLVNKIVKPKNWIIYLLIAIHVFFLGYKGWFTPENWHGSLPPLTLISFVVMVILILVNVLRRNKN